MNLAATTGVPASIAGTAVAQSSGSDLDRAKSNTAAQQRTITSELHAETAAGVGETDGEDHTINDRDADGRQMWEFKSRESAGAAKSRQSRDPSGKSGGELDISG